MSEMVKRAAHAAFAEITRQCEANGNTAPDDFSDGDFTRCLAYNGFNLLAAVRAAIETMREPTEAMCEAGARYYHDNYQEGRAKEQTTMPDIWREMVDEALKESEPASRS